MVRDRFVVSMSIGGCSHNLTFFSLVDLCSVIDILVASVVLKLLISQRADIYETSMMGPSVILILTYQQAYETLILSHLVAPPPPPQFTSSWRQCCCVCAGSLTSEGD